MVIGLPPGVAAHYREAACGATRSSRGRTGTNRPKGD